MASILEINNVRKSYGKKEILKGISLSVEEGEIISVLGPSGCGKSTLLNLIAGILPLDGGSISINGRVVSDSVHCTAPDNRNINMVFQDFALWPHMKARDNILYGLKLRKTAKSEQKGKLDEVVSMLHLEGLLEQYPSELSGGQQQRVAIARALITRPAIILLDEPLCNLDIQLRVEMRTEMSQLFHSLNTTVFHVTHDPSEAFAMADRIVVMNEGLIEQDDTPGICYLKPKTAMTAGLLGAGNSIKNAVLRKREGGFFTAETGGALLTGTGFLKAGAEPSDGNAEVLEETACELRFRPEECSYSTTPWDNSLPVTTVLSTFEGGIYRVKVKTKDGTELCLLHGSFIPEGDTGYLRVDREKLYVYT